MAQFSYVSEYLPKVFPVHLRGTGSGFATNVGGRMLGTMAAIAEHGVARPAVHRRGNPQKVAKAAAVIGGAVYAVALVLSFLLPPPREEELGPAPASKTRERELVIARHPETTNSGVPKFLVSCATGFESVKPDAEDSIMRLLLGVLGIAFLMSMSSTSSVAADPPIKVTAKDFLTDFIVPQKEPEPKKETDPKEEGDGAGTQEEDQSGRRQIQGEVGRSDRRDAG